MLVVYCSLFHTRVMHREIGMNNIVLIEVKGDVWTVFFADGTTVVVVR